MSRLLSLAIAFILTTSAFAQSNRLTYTEEFAGTSLASGSIGALGWNAEGDATVSHVFSGQNGVHTAGYVSLQLPFDQPPGWGAITLGALLPVDRNVTIPFNINNDTWSSQFSFLLNAPAGNVAHVGFFIPQPAPGGFTSDGCYVKTLFYGSNFQYVCKKGAASVSVDSGVPFDGGYYTLRIKSESSSTVAFSLTKLNGINGAENLESLRSVPSQGVFSDSYNVPSFQAKGSDVFLMADYFFFDLQKVRR